MNESNVSLEAAYTSLVKDSRLCSASLQETFSIIAQLCAEALSLSSASIWLLSKDRSQLACQTRHPVNTSGSPCKSSIDVNEIALYFDALCDEDIVSFDNTQIDNKLESFCASQPASNGNYSVLDAVLRQQGEGAGMLRFEMCGEHRQWKTEERLFIASIADLLSQRLRFQDLIQSEENYKSLYKYSNEGIVIFQGPSFVNVNPAACKLFGGSVEDLVGKNPIDLSPEFQKDGRPSAETAMGFIQACMGGIPQNFEWTHKRLDGSEFMAEVTLNAVRFGGEDTLFALVKDITARKEAERVAAVAQNEIAYRAAHDSLTGLQNREQLHAYVDKLIARVNEDNESLEVALLLFDLNRFKEINDTLGHSTGDKVLVKLADLLRDPVAQNGGGLFRLGGDEFVAVFDSESCDIPFSQLDMLLNDSLKTTIDLDDIGLELSASIGIAVFPENGKDSHELLRCADVAMYNAKHNGDISSWYNLTTDLHNKRRLAMMVELGSAIREDKLVLHFQPRINISTGELTGCEALVRWQHEKLGLVPPGDFLPLAEMSELIHPLSEWVLKNSINQIKRLHANGYHIPVAMNISARNLTDAQLVDSLEAILKLENINPKYLEIEITESALIDHPQKSLENLKRLDELGLSIAIDDFGTGYSSLSYLKQLPLDTLKVDRSFVTDMLNNESDSMIVDSTINLAHNFSFTVVAEGVEDQETLDALAARNCDQAQGYFIARPMTADDFEIWLQSYNAGDTGLAKAS